MPKLDLNWKKESSSLTCLQKKEREAYSALSAFLSLLDENNKLLDPPKKYTDFEAFKRAVLNQSNCVQLTHSSNESCSSNQFESSHYVEAITSATSSNYRNMAILAAIGDLNSASLLELIKKIKEKCLNLSEKVRQAEYVHLSQSIKKNRHDAVVIDDK